MKVFSQKDWLQVAALHSFMSWVDSNGQLESQLETFQAIKWCSSLGLTMLQYNSLAFCVGL